jgi:hypothetical protein
MMKSLNKKTNVVLWVTLIFATVFAGMEIFLPIAVMTHFGVLPIPLDATALAYIAQQSPLIGGLLLGLCVQILYILIKQSREVLAGYLVNVGMAVVVGLLVLLLGFCGPIYSQFVINSLISMVFFAALSLVLLLVSRSEYGEEEE